MNDEIVEQKVIGILNQFFPVAKESITRATTFEELGGDSLDAVDIAMEVENEFTFNVEDEVAEAFKTVGELIDYVIRKIK